MSKHAVFIDPEATHAFVLEGVTFALRTLTAREMFRVESVTKGVQDKTRAAAEDAMADARLALDAFEALDVSEVCEETLASRGRDIQKALDDAIEKWNKADPEKRGEKKPSLLDVVEVTHFYNESDLGALGTVLRIGIASWEGPGVPVLNLKVERDGGCRMIQPEAIDLIRPKCWAAIFGALMSFNQQQDDQRAE